MKTFRDDLKERLKNDVFAREFQRERRKLRIAYSLHKARMAKGWTQKELAEKANMTQQMVSRIENAGTPQFTFGSLLRMADALGFEVDIVPSDDKKDGTRL